jgi:hypothetical protein
MLFLSRFQPKIILKIAVITLNKMINKKCYTVGKVPKSNRKISERGKSIPLTHLYRYP